MSYFSEAVARRGLGSPYDLLIVESALNFGLDPSLLKGVISAESAWNPTATDGKGSWGLMQINVTAWGITVAQAQDPAFAIPFGAHILAEQVGRRPTLLLALAAYNAGTSRSDADLQTRLDGNVNGVANYAATVLDYAGWFQSHESGPPAPPPEGGGGPPPFRRAGS